MSARRSRHVITSRHVTSRANVRAQSATERIDPGTYFTHAVSPVMTVGTFKMQGGWACGMPHYRVHINLSSLPGRQRSTGHYRLKHCSTTNSVLEKCWMILASRFLHVCKTVVYFFVISVAVFCFRLSTYFLDSSHDKMSCSHSTST